VGGEHEDDEQDQDDIDERRDVDVRNGGASTSARPGSAAIGGEGHRLLSAETALRQIEELQRKVVHAGAQFPNQMAEVVIEDGGGDGGEQAHRGGDQGFGDAGGDGFEAGGAHLAEVLESPYDAHHSAHQADKWGDGGGGGQPVHVAFQLGQFFA